MTDVEAVNRDDGFVLFDDGNIGNICHMVDFFGDETMDADDAIVVIAVHPISLQFHVIELADFDDKATVH